MKRFLIIVTGLAVAALAPAAAAQSPDDRNVYRGMNPQIVDVAKATSPDDRPLPRGTTPPPDFVDRYVARVSRYGAPGDIHPDACRIAASTGRTSVSARSAASASRSRCWGRPCSCCADPCGAHVRPKSTN
jgi:hypothetical protein